MADHARRVILGRGSASFRGLGFVALLGPLVIAYLMATDRAQTALVPNLAGIGAVEGFFVLGLSLSLAGVGEALILTGMITVWTVPVASILRLTHDHGLEIRTTYGITVRSWGYGDSLIGSVTGNRQASAAQDRIDAWLLNHPTQQPAEAAPPPVRRPRLAALGIIAACMAVFVLTGLVVHLIVVGS